MATNLENNTEKLRSILAGLANASVGGGVSTTITKINLNFVNAVENLAYLPLLATDIPMVGFRVTSTDLSSFFDYVQNGIINLQNSKFVLSLGEMGSFTAVGIGQYYSGQFGLKFDLSNEFLSIPHFTTLFLHKSFSYIISFGLIPDGTLLDFVVNAFANATLTVETKA